MGQAVVATPTVQLGIEDTALTKCIGRGFMTRLGDPIPPPPMPGEEPSVVPDRQYRPAGGDYPVCENSNAAIKRDVTHSRSDESDEGGGGRYLAVHQFEDDPEEPPACDVPGWPARYTEDVTDEDGTEHKKGDYYWAFQVTLPCAECTVIPLSDTKLGDYSRVETFFGEPIFNAYALGTLERVPPSLFSQGTCAAWAAVQNFGNPLLPEYAEALSDMLFPHFFGELWPEEVGDLFGQFTWQADDGDVYELIAVGCSAFLRFGGIPALQRHTDCHWLVKRTNEFGDTYLRASVSNNTIPPNDPVDLTGQAGCDGIIDYQFTGGAGGGSFNDVVLSVRVSNVQ